MAYRYNTHQFKQESTIRVLLALYGAILLYPFSSQQISFINKNDYLSIRMCLQIAICNKRKVIEI